MNIIPRFSMNFNGRPTQEPISLLVLHYTGMKTGDEALLRLCDPEAQVSAHYVVEEDGTIYQLVEEDMRAWHAGVSSWRGRENINDISIGIEIVNPGHEFGYRPFPPAQMAAVAALCQDILARHPIPPRNVVGHSDIAPTRKEDPGELFDWAWLAEQGVGLFPVIGCQVSGEQEGRPVGRPSPERSEAATHCGAQDLRERSALVGATGKERGAGVLKDYGYPTENLPKTILAFQRHFRPSNLTGEWDAECEEILAKLLEMV